MFQKIINGISLVSFFLIIIVGIFYVLKIRSEYVFVDSAKITNGYQGMLDARKTYQAKAVLWKANIDTLFRGVRDDIMKYETESSRMTKREQELSKQLIVTKQKQLADFQQATSEKAKQEDETMTRDVMNHINAYIKEYGKKANYKIIFAASEFGTIAYAEQYLDITNEILDGLNKEYQGK